MPVTHSVVCRYFLVTWWLYYVKSNFVFLVIINLTCVEHVVVRNAANNHYYSPSIREKIVNVLTQNDYSVIRILGE